MMKALFIKDLRMQRHVMVLAAALLFGPAVVYALVEISSTPPGGRPWQQGWSYAREGFAEMSLFGVALSSLAFPAIFGVAAARERRDRSGDFLESLPVSRWRVVFSRLLAATLCALTPLVCGIGIAFLLVPAWLSDLRSSQDLIDAIRSFFVFSAVGSFLVGVAWMVGSAAKSEVRAALCSLLTVFAVMVATHQIIDRMQMRGVAASESTVATVFMLVAATFGLTTFAIGLTIALRRRTP